ncbi:hyaluronan mediated motility receptor-like isoform X4 [Dermacentor silvarum]|uniref:hyaluronan mediated motility receptor-like isoform X4 n=1 Tax=Dermacentor silvarum TaxID=543639 RepID=UPI00210143A1|nr:hyaluronan mediated motility receptor-like isoform X4 [Dermacentor silvarum]
MSFPKAPRFPGGNDDVPPVGSYNPALESRTPAPKFCSATRFRDTHGASFFTPGGSYRMPPIPLHASKELLKRRLSEMAQHLEERDMLIGQLRVSKGKLHTRVSQLEELLRGLSRKVSAKNETLHGARKSKSCKASRTSRQDIEDTRALLKELGDTDTAEEAFCEVRLSKGTQELKEELNDMIDKMNADDSEAHNTDLMDAYDEENASFKTKVFLVEQELKALSNMLTNMTTEKQELEKNVADIYIERSSLREIVEDIEAKCRELHHKLVCQKKENTAKDTQIEQLVLENEVLQNKAQSLADCNEELNAVLDRVKAAKHELEEKVAETCKENSSLKASIEDLEAKHTELHHELVCQKKENTAKGTQIEQLVLENEMLQNKAQSLADCKQELNAILERVIAEKHELEEKVAETCKENSSLKASIENLEAKHTELHHDLVCQKKENTAKGTQIEQLVLENEMLQNKAQSLADCKQELNAILERVKAEMHELEEKVAETCKENSSLKASIENLEAKHTELHHELVCQKKENTAKGTQIEQLVLENEMLQSKAQSLADCKQELNAILERVKAEKHELVEKVAETCKENSSLKASIENLEAKHTELHQELVSQKKENTAKGTQIEQLVLENEVLQNKAQSLADCKQELIALNDALTQVKLEKEEGEKRVAELHMEKTAIERSLEDLASKYHKLHHEAMQYQEEKVILYMRMDEVVKQNEVLKANVQILEGLKSKWEQQHLLLTDCIEDLQFKLDKAHCEEAELKSSVALLNREISNHEQLKQDMLKELVDFGDILTLKTSLEERLASALVEVDSLHSSNKEFAKKTSALEDANRVAQDNISELLKEKKQLEESIQSCHEIRNGIEVKLSDATRNLNIWKEKAEVLSCENRRRDEELADCAQQLKAAVLRADKYKCVCSELDRQKRELRDQLKQLSEELTQVKDEMQVAAEFYEMMVSRLSWWLSLEHFLSSNWDIHARQVNNLTEQLNSTAADAERWKTSFEALQMRVSPFQEQLELYELEKQLLERRNEATESELSKLHEKVSKMMGHQNHKQKIRYLSNLLKERDDFKKELYTLRQKTLKQTKEIVRLELQLSQKLKQGQKGLFDHSAKENVLPKPPM